MIGFGSATRVYLAAGATDMRKGFEGCNRGTNWNAVSNHHPEQPIAP